ncbi:MAG: polysaccharide biosynthesis/export family protein [Planctomycetota bacterium]|jgi:protein involved in polysaccharide export with SLBB domain
MIRPSLHIARYPLAAVILALGGCNVTSYFDPSKTGRFEKTPTTIPILERIDVIERDPDPWAKASPVTPDDLLPSDLTYRLAAGDLITVEILELMMQGQLWESGPRRIDASGNFRFPAPIGDIRAAGLTTQEFQDEVVRVVDQRVMRAPMVNVVVVQGAGFSYTIYGAVAGTGIYTLPSAEHRLLDALAMAGGVPLMTQKIYVIRQVPLAEDVIFEPARRAPIPRPEAPEEGPGDIEELIRQLEQPQRPSRPQQRPPERPPIDIEELLEELDDSPPAPPAERPAPDAPPVDVDDLLDEPSGHVAPGAYYQESGPPIDIEELEPIQVPSPPAYRQDRDTGQPPAVPPPPTVTLPPAAEETYIYIPERDEWVPVRAEAPPDRGPEQLPAAEPEKDLFVQPRDPAQGPYLRCGAAGRGHLYRRRDRPAGGLQPAGVRQADPEPPGGRGGRPGPAGDPGAGGSHPHRG